MHGLKILFLKRWIRIYIDRAHSKQQYSRIINEIIYIYR